MYLKKKDYNLLDKSIEKLTKILEKSNVTEIAYILGNRKEIIKRNLIARNI